jgi:hypothetical protein
MEEEPTFGTCSYDDEGGAVSGVGVDVEGEAR